MLIFISSRLAFFVKKTRLHCNKSTTTGLFTAMKYRHMPLPTYATLLSSVLLLQVAAQSPTNQPPPVVAPAVPTAPAAPRLAAPAPVKEEKLQSFKFEQADLDLVMSQYCSWTGQFYLKNDTVKATITIKADRLTTQESIEVIEAILGMNNIALVPMGEKFIKVVLANAPDLVGHGGDVNLDPIHEYAGTDRLVTQIIPLEYAEIQEVENAVRQLMHAYGKILALQSSNSLMITDTEANIIRIREMIEFLDKATARIEPRIYHIKYADATEIAAKLNEIVAMAQADQKKASGASPSRSSSPNVRTPPGVIRARTTRPGSPTQASISQTGAASSVIIQGSVKVMADERTNVILIFSQEENFAFFDKIIEVFDVEVEPAISFEVINLEYADAEELSGTLNELVGAAQGSKSTSSGSSSRSSNSRSTSQRPSSSSRQVRPNATTGALQSLSKLSENTKILADQRSNSILLMGEKSDIAVIKNVISSLDIMLEQVMIEAAIFEVTLGDELEHGIQWLYKSQGLDKVGSWDGAGLVTNVVGNVASGALTYYQNLAGIDSQLAVKLSASDSNVRLLSTPVIMTTDNTEARLSIGEQRPVVTSTSSFANSSGTQSSNYEYKDIGIQLTVTPRVNPQRVVIMEILQKADQVGDEITIDGNLVPVIFQREFEATIAVPDRGTIALGGLINTEMRDSVSKIPILGDIPLIGRYLFSSVNKKERQTELIVLMTPYVLTNGKEAVAETERRYDASDMQPEDWPKKGWSDSPLRFRPKPDADADAADAVDTEDLQPNTSSETSDILELMEEAGTE